MLAQITQELRNAEKSIKFIQKQHAKILDDLHQEIDELQKKNVSKFYSNYKQQHLIQKINYL